MKKKDLLCLLLFVFQALLLTAQGGAPEPLTAAEKKTVVDSVARLLADNYVFPDKGKEMAGLLQKQLKNGAYDGIELPGVFAEKLTEDLRSVTHDKHLHVDFAPQQVREMRERAGRQPEDRPEDWLNRPRFDNFGFKEVKILPGNIGYLDLRGFFPAEYAGETASAAMNFLSNCGALIIDLRENGGGSPSMIQLLTTYLYSGEEPIHLNNFYWRPEDRTTQTWTLPFVPGKRMDKADVYVLTSNRTFSAAEEFTYNLKNLKRATIVGETTGGGAHPGGTEIATDRFTVWIPRGRAINPITNTNWEGTGVAPDIAVPKDKALDMAQAAALEKLAAKPDNGFKKLYEWYLPLQKIKVEPVKTDPETLKSYAGKYGPRILSFENGELYYQREGNPRYKLTALAEDLFMFEEAAYFRLKILKENGKVVGLKGLYDNGNEDVSMKEKATP